MKQRIGIIGSGSWGTALAKILTDNGNSIHWWIRQANTIEQIRMRKHHPHYLSSAHLQADRMQFSTNLQEIIQASDLLVIAIPAAYLEDTLSGLPKDAFQGKQVISAVKGILPNENSLLNEYLEKHFQLSLENYFSVMGPCHAEEVAAEKLSYLTFSGLHVDQTKKIAEAFRTPYLNTLTNRDVFGVQYAAILKNIYAIAAGMAHGLDYGDNFLSVLIANCADEMAVFLRKAGILNPEVGYAHASEEESAIHNHYSASVYLGDLLVTCYSLHSRNRSFGNMIGKGYSVKAAMLEMNMVAEGYNASRCMHIINKQVLAEMPIATTVYQILWEGLSAEEGFRRIEAGLV
jgi:glycerol-3-phosphate dehydrogenase (NAD(P)+)